MNAPWPTVVDEPPRIRNYLIAIGTSLGALLFAWLFHTPTTSFVVAVMITSYMGSRLAGYLATALGGLLFYLTFLRSHTTFVILSSPIHQLIAFLVTGCIICEVAQMSRRTEQKRLRSVAELQTMMETCPDAILLLDSWKRITCLNPAAVSLFGCSREELLGRPITQFIPGFATGMSPSSDFDAVTATGEPLRLSAAWSVLDQQTNVFLRDVTQRREMETILKASEESLKLLVETIPALLFVLDARGQLEQVNHRVTDYNGLTLKEMLEDNGLSAVHPDDKAKSEEIRERQLAFGLPISYEFRYKRRDGAYRWFHANIEPLKNSKGEVIRWYSLLTDIDDRKTMEASLRVTQDELARAHRISTVAEIAASVVHEISQPLSAIALNSQICLRDLATAGIDQDQIKGTVERIVKNSQEASQIVRNIRALFRRRDPDTRPVDLQQIIEEVLLLHEAQIRDLGIAVNLSVAEDLPQVPADRIQIQQVLVNLVLNAIESMTLPSEYGRQLDLHACRVDGKVLVTVADRGHGFMSAERLFDPFFTTKETGMGMGLRICKTIVEAHQGDLWAATRPDKGSSFTFSLPVQSGDA